MNAESRVQQWINQYQQESIILTWTQPWLEIKLHRLQHKNALNGALIQHLKAIFDFIESTPDIRAVILTGGESNFCAGADLQEIAQLRAHDQTALFTNNKHYGELLHRIHLCRVPVIAIVDGPALGGGMGLACASDLIYATQTASFGMPEPKLGIIAGQILPYVYRKLGLARTQEMALQGLRIYGPTSLKWGLTNQVFESYPAMLSNLTEVLTNIQSCGPEALFKTKTMLNRLNSINYQAINHQAIETTALDVVAATLSPEGIEGSAAFLSKRNPKWNQKKIMES